MESCRRYCLQYWRSLAHLVELAAKHDFSPALQRAIGAAVTFESFSVTDAPGRHLAAATTTLRNPIYLLARLKWPTVPDSTRFLPLIALADAQATTFGHYRRYPVSEDGDLSLLVYPKNQAGGDPGSLSAISVLANRLGTATDPFVADRSERLWEHVFRPLLEDHAPAHGVATFDFVDLGAGTGALTALLGGKLVSWAEQQGVIPRLRIALVDSGGTALSERFSDPALRRSIEGLSRIPIDYRSWLTLRRATSQRRGLRFGLACKIFDMASQFDIRRFAKGELPNPPSDESWFDHMERSPAEGVASGIPDRHALMTSAYRFEVSDGHVLAQPALSDYFAGLLALMHGVRVPDGLYLPVRRFEPSALVTSDGGSVLAELLNQTDFAVIEDADLRPQELVEHVRRFGLRDIVVENMTAAMRLAGNYAYVLSKREFGATRPLGGERML
jgi:hypothetical protein